MDVDGLPLKGEENWSNTGIFLQKQPSFCEVLIRFQKFVLLFWCDGHQLLYEIIITIWVGSMFCSRYFKSTRNQSAFRADMLLRYLPLALCALGLWPWMVLRLAPQWSWGEGHGPLVCNLPNSTWVWELLVTEYWPWSKQARFCLSVINFSGHTPVLVGD